MTSTPTDELKRRLLAVARELASTEWHTLIAAEGERLAERLASEIDAVADLLSSPRPDGVPDDAVAEAVRLLEAATPGPWSWSKRSDRLSGGPNGYDDVMTAREHRDGPEIEVLDEDAELIAAAPTVIANLLTLLGVPVPPYQPTPPEPEPADVRERHVKHYRTCNCLADTDECCVESCSCHAPVSEVRTGPLGLSEDEVRKIAAMPYGNVDECPARVVLACREFVSRWDAEDAAPAETLADIVASLRRKAGNMRPGFQREAGNLSLLADRIEAAAGLSVPSEGGES